MLVISPLAECCSSVSITFGNPCHFSVKKISPATTRYCAFDRELLAAYATIRHFRHNLEVREFFVNTDHKPLTSVLTERSSLLQTRYLAYIAEFTPDIRYVKGETNFVADALSRPSVSAIDCDSAINYEDLNANQALDTEFTRLRHSTSSTLDFDYLKPSTTYWYGAMYQPDTQDRKKFRRNTSRFRTPISPIGINIDIANWCTSCTGCQTAKVSRHN